MAEKELLWELRTSLYRGGSFHSLLQQQTHSWKSSSLAA